MHKTIIFVLLISFMLSACQKEQVPEKNILLPEIRLDAIAETLSAVKETSAKKDISEYEDCRAVTLNATKEIAENPIFIFLMHPEVDYNRDCTMDELCRHAVSIVRGTIVDLSYYYGDLHGGTYYSFAVSEVLWGEAIAPETIITVQEDQGILPLTAYRANRYFNAANAYSEFIGDDDVDRTYFIESASEPFVKIGDEFVLFLGDGSRFESGNIIGNWYYTGYDRKYKRNEDGLYERTIPELLRDLNAFQSANLEPVTLDELKEQIAEAQAAQN